MALPTNCSLKQTNEATLDLLLQITQKESRDAKVQEDL